MSIFDARKSLKPYEYPELLPYKDAIRHAYWLHTEFNFSSDVQDFKVNISSSERNAVKNSMLAISQIEVSVKTFWGDIYKRMPKPEIGAIGATFSDSEARHMDAYSALLELLGLDSEFEKIYDIPAIIDRVDYLNKYLDGSKSRDDKKYALSVLLFSVFIENVSLFSQFLIMMSFNKYKNIFKGISNVVEATSKEEAVHGQFGVAIVNILKKEFPEWFDEDLLDQVKKACLKAYKAETKVLDWIFEEGELSFLPRVVVDEFIKNRFNNSLNSIGIEDIFEINAELLEQTEWFEEELTMTKENDFFNKRGTAYSKKTKSFDEEDMF